MNLAKPLRLKENSTRPVWADDEWLQKYSGQTLKKGEATEGGGGGGGEPAKGTEETAAAKRPAGEAAAATTVRYSALTKSKYSFMASFTKL